MVLTSSQYDRTFSELLIYLNKDILNNYSLIVTHLIKRVKNPKSEFSLTSNVLDWNKYFPYYVSR